jgi:predicted ATPase
MFNRARFIVLTGGPGAGKSAVMAAVRQIYGSQVAILPEAASIVYSGGFPRFNTEPSIRSAQRAICRVQEELERYVIEEGKHSVALCDRGIVDGAAYWPHGKDSFFEAIGWNREEVFSRYHAVIHLKTPGVEMGYDYSNPMRTETPAQAAELDRKIELVWAGHPNRFVVPATERFQEKLEQVTDLILATLPNSIPQLPKISSTANRNTPPNYLS